jgi:hypothetical protein
MLMLPKLKSLADTSLLPVTPKVATADRKASRDLRARVVTYIRKADITLDDDASPSLLYMNCIMLSALTAASYTAELLTDFRSPNAKFLYVPLPSHKRAFVGTALSIFSRYYGKACQTPSVWSY